MTTITAPKEALYLSDFMTELPKGILNKKATGVGGSLMAISSDKSYIVACPTVELIHNKQSQHSEIFGIYSGITYEALRDYVSNSPTTYKIFTTYDSLGKTVTWLKSLGINAYSKCRLLVDEYHKILSDYSYRDKAINSLLKESLKFEHYTFLSATPINPKFTPAELEELDYYEIEWSNLIKKKPDRIKTNKPFQAAVNIIKQYKLGNYSITKKIGEQELVSREAYFFVNSVKAIKDIIDNAKLLPSEVKIICADSPRNREVLDEFSIGHTSDPNKPFTFITSKSFLGVDIYSDSGIAYVISNVGKKTTLLDISTDLYQISGRIRNINNPFKDTICHIFNVGASEMSPEEFKDIVQQKVEDTHQQIDLFNNVSELQKKAILKRFEMDMEDDYSYYNPETNILEFNNLKKLNEEFNYEIVHEIYKNGLSVREAYIKAGFDISNNQEFLKLEETFFDKLTKYSFKEVLKEYCQLIDSNENLDRQRQIELLEPEIKECVEKLGTTKVKALKFVKGKIKSAMYNNCEEVTNAIIDNLKIQLVPGSFYTTEQLKSILNNEFKQLKVNKSIKGSLIEDYLDVKKTTKRINGKVTSGYLVKE